MAEAERLLGELTAEGVEYADVLEGAKRWAAYNAVTGGKKRASPLRWLQSEKWRDGWEMPIARKKIQSGEAETAPKAKGEKGNPAKKKDTQTKRAKNPEFKKWELGYKSLPSDEPYMDKFREHQKICTTCDAAIKDHDFKCLCDQSKRLIDKMGETRKAEQKYRKENPTPPRWLIKSEDGQWAPEGTR